MEVVEKAKTIALIVKESWEGVELNSDKLKEVILIQFFYLKIPILVRFIDQR